MNKFFKSFVYAIKGIIFCFFSEKNFRFHIFFSIFVIILSFIFRINRIEWATVLSAIFFVLITEMINTAIEKTLDLIDENYNEKIKIIKNISAGFVFLAAIYSMLVGILVFLPKIFSVFVS